MPKNLAGEGAEADSISSRKNYGGVMGVVEAESHGNPSLEAGYRSTMKQVEKSHLAAI